MKGINSFPKKGGFFAAPCFPSFFSVGFLQQSHLPSHYWNELIFPWFEPPAKPSLPGHRQLRGARCLFLTAFSMDFSPWIYVSGEISVCHVPIFIPRFLHHALPLLTHTPNLAAFILWHTNHLPACSCPRSETPVIPDIFFDHRWMPFFHCLRPHGFTILLLSETLVLHLSTTRSQLGDRALFSVLSPQFCFPLVCLNHIFPS